MKTRPASRHATGEVTVLGKEPVARMHGVGAGASRRVDDARDVQIAVRRQVAAKMARFVGEPDVQRRAIAVRVDGDRAEAQLATRAHQPHGNLAAVCYENSGQRALGAPSAAGSTRPARTPAVDSEIPPGRPHTPSILASGSRPNRPGSRRRAERQSGMLPCFFGGFLSRLVSSAASAVMSFWRVARGGMTSSMKP